MLFVLSYKAIGYNSVEITWSILFEQFEATFCEERLASQSIQHRRARPVRHDFMRLLNTECKHTKKPKGGTKLVCLSVK